MYKKKILIDGVIFGLQKAGGISRLFAEILSGLDTFVQHNPNWEVILLVPKNQNVEFQLLSSSLKNIKSIKRRRFKWGKGSFLGQCFYLTFLALKFRPHVWHSSYYIGFPLFFGGCKMITFHDMIPEMQKRASSYETHLKYRALKKSDKIFSISQHSKKDLLSFWPEFISKVDLIENGMALGEEKKEESSPYFLFVGKRRGYKNFLPTVQAILKDERFKYYSIYVVGGEEEISKEEQALERIKWFNTLSLPEVKELMTRCTVLLFPSLYEGFGFPVLEAFHYEVPVLAYKATSIPEVTGVGYPLIDPKHPEQLTDVLDQLIRERVQWIAYGRERKQLFSREKMMKKLTSYYETV